MSIKRSRQSEANLVEKDVSNLMSLPVEFTKEVPDGSSSSEVMKPPLKCPRRTLNEGNGGNLRPNGILNPARRTTKFPGFGEFPKYCHYCTKEIDLRKDVYMYREWCAFCTVECRDRQIELDEKFQKSQ